MNFTVWTNQFHTTMIIKLSFLLVLTRVSSHTDIFYQFTKNLYITKLYSLISYHAEKNLFVSTQNCRKLPSFLICLDPLFPPPSINFLSFNKNQTKKLVIFKLFLYLCDSWYYSNVKKMISIFPVIY